jgi:hypothetical protein
LFIHVGLLPKLSHSATEGSPKYKSYRFRGVIPYAP